MNRREKILSLAVAALAFGLAGEQWVVEPALAWYRGVRAETVANQERLDEAQLLIDHGRQITADWRARHRAGLLDDENTARFNAQQALGAAARTSGFTMEGQGGGQRIAAGQDQSYDLMRLTLSGHGSLAQTQAFLAAIEETPLPWRVERCELAARDGRKDRLDGALTLSLRLASPAVRDKLTVPAKTAPWRPAARSGTLDAAILKARPFLSDRGAPAAAPGGATREAPPPPQPPPPGSGFNLVGLVTRDGVGEALVVCAADGKVRTVRTGDQVAGGTAKRVDADGLLMDYGDGERLVQPGLALTGGPPADAGQTPPAATGTASPNASAATAENQTEADRKAILQRLRENRNRASN